MWQIVNNITFRGTIFSAASALPLHSKFNVMCIYALHNFLKVFPVTQEKKIKKISI